MSATHKTLKRIEMKEPTVSLTEQHAPSFVFNAFRSFTDLKRDHNLFSLATPSTDNDLLIFRDVINDEIELCSRNIEAGFRGWD